MRVVRRGHKFGAVSTMLHGVRFASRAEARRYEQLLLLGKAGEIADLELQPSFPLKVNGETVGTYRGDFAYVDLRTGSRVVEDVKGIRLPLYKWKVKHLRIQEGIVVQEVSGR